MEDLPRLEVVGRLNRGKIDVVLVLSQTPSFMSRTPDASLSFDIIMTSGVLVSSPEGPTLSCPQTLNRPISVTKGKGFYPLSIHGALGTPPRTTEPRGTNNGDETGCRRVYLKTGVQ